MALGVLLLVTEGTSSLGGVLGTTQQMQLEGWVYDVTRAVPNVVIVLLVVIVAGGAWVAARWVRRNRREAVKP